MEQNRVEVTAQEIYEREGFLVLCSRGPLLVGSVIETRGTSWELSAGIEAGTKVVVVSETSFAEAKRHQQAYGPTAVPLYDHYRYYKVIAE